MDVNGAAAPRREPGFLGGLTPDQQDLLNLRLREHRENKFSQMTQRDDIRIWDSDSDLQSLLKNKKK